ncbi:MAG: hypothetical protein IPH88_05290 [Bacteroidales bacterium]|nr:hypothetical protein [Bacteroidales bacterium]
MNKDIPLSRSKNIQQKSTKRIISYLLIIIISQFLISSCQKKTSPASPIIAEISVKEIILRLASNPEDSLLNYCLQKTAEIKQKSNDDFYSIFEKVVLQSAPDQRLSEMFPYLIEQHQITALSGNDEVIRAIRSVSADVYANVRYIITGRLLQSNIKFEWIKENLNKDRLMIMLKNQADSSRIQNLVESKGRLEFWETSTLKEIFSDINEANKYLKSIDALKSLSLSPKQEVMRSYVDKNLLNYFLQLNLYQGDDGNYYPSDIAEIGSSVIMDTANINKLLSLSQKYFPRQLKFVWERWPFENLNSTCINLIALHSDLPGCAPYIQGSLLGETRIVKQGNQYWVRGEFNIDGQQAIRRLTGRNIDRQIAILLDGHCLYYPRITEEISIGGLPLTKLLEKNEAIDCSSILSCGELPVTVRIIRPTTGKEI